MTANVLDTGQEFFEAGTLEDMLQLLEKIPFSDPSLWKSTFGNFGKQVYDCLHKLDAREEKDDDLQGHLRTSIQRAVEPNFAPLAPSSSTAGGYHGEYDVDSRPLPSGVVNIIQDDIERVIPVCMNLDPEGMLDDKLPETATVDSSKALIEISVPCTAPKTEVLPPVEEPPSDMVWSTFAEDTPEDCPAQQSPLEGCIPAAFDEDFTSVLYSLCEDYQDWVTEAVAVMWNERLLKEKYQAVAALESDDFQTPLSPAECVSLVMAYELYRTSESEQKTATFLGWIAQQLNLERRTSACRFACLTLLGGICFLVESKCFSEAIPKEMTTLLQQAISVDDLAVAQMAINWHPSSVNVADWNGWTAIHLAAKKNAPAMIRILCDKAAEKEPVTSLGNTPLLVAVLAHAEEAITALLVEKADPNLANRDGWTSVHYAASADKAHVVELLHQHGGQLHTTTVEENSPLSLAVMNDAQGAAAMLMKLDSKLADWKNANDWTALHLAASKNAPTALQILSGFAEVDINTRTRSGHTPLAIAVMQGCLQATEVLLKAKANPDVVNTEGWSALHIAAQKDSCSIVCLLCEAGANTEIQTDLKSTPLCIAAMYGHSETVAELLKQNANPNTRNNHGWSPIHYAAAVNADKMVRQIGQVDGADMDLKTNEGNTPLILAITHGARVAANIMVEAGADVNVKEPEGWSALHFAVDQDDLEVIETLSDGGADVNAMCNECKTPLMLAVMKASARAVQALLGALADPNLKDRHGWSALHMAAVSDKTAEILQLVIRNGACMDGMTNKGNTALALAVMSNLVENAKALLHGKANPSICGPHSWSPLHLAAERNCVEMVELLCSFDADPNTSNKRGYTPLVISVAKDCKEAAGALLKNNADPGIQSELNGWSALHFAAQEDNLALGELLCDFSTDLNVKTHKGNPPLLIAAMKGSQSVMSTLLARKADVNAWDSHRWTALHCAARSNACNIVSLLRAHSADCSVQTDKGNTPLAIAAIHESAEVAEELIKMGADLNAKNCDDWTPLCCALYKGSFKSELIERLCSPINVSMQTKQHGTPLHLCDLQQNTAYTNCLLEHGAQRTPPTHVVPYKACITEPVAQANELPVLHSEAQSGLTGMNMADCDSYPENIDANTVDSGSMSLHVAARNGQKDIVRSHLEQNEDLAYAPGEHGYLPIQFAVMGDQPAVVELLSHYYYDAKGITDNDGCSLLHLAAKYNSAQVAKQLLCQEHDSNKKDRNGYCPIHVAALNGSTAVIEVLLQHDVGMIALQGDNGYTVLHCAAKGGQAKVVELICSNYQGEALDLHAVDKKNNTSLHTAAHNGQKEVVSVLLEQKKELVNVPGEHGYLPIQFAVMGDQPAVVELISHYYDAKGITNNDDCNLLHLAARCNCAMATKQLLSDGHRPDTEDSHGRCPIHAAALYGSTNVIDTYLHHDIEMVSLPGVSGNTLLHFAAMGGHVEVVEMICSNYQGFVNVNVVNSLGETPLHVAAQFKAANAEMIKALCNFGADVTISDCFGDTALHFAVLRDDEEKARALLSIEPTLVDVPGASGEVPLHWAVKKSSSNMIATLREEKCDVSVGDQYGNTPLHFATAYTRNEAIVQQLLASKADPEKPNSEASGADPEKPNSEGHSALDFAASQDARNCFMAILDEAQKAYHIDKVFYNMHRVHEYVGYQQMDKAGRLMSSSIPSVLYSEYLKDDHKHATDKVTLVGIMKKSEGEINCQSPFKAVLDKCVYGSKVIRRPALFEADASGHLPGTDGYDVKDGSFLSNLVNKPKLLFAMADHPALQAYVSYRWEQIASPFFWRGLLFYLFQLFLLTFALASAARPDLPLNGGYRDPIDIFRGICEVAILIITVVKIGIEGFEFVSNWKAYLLDWLNYAQLFAIALILLLIPLRATAHPGQWVVAALAYFTFGLQAFEFLLLSSFIGIYVQTLTIIIWRDIVKFLGMFAVILMIFSGSVYFSLRYDADLANSTTAAILPGEGSFLQEAYFTGLRTMIEAGSILNYYSGTGSVFGALTVILYLLFLFLVVIILLNVLIAQVSETYGAVQSTARATLLFHRSRFITRCEESTALWFLLWTFQWGRIRSCNDLCRDVESQTNTEHTQRKCCRCLRRKTVREEFYCHDDDAMYWPGQLFHKNKDKNFKTKDGEYRDSSPRAKFWRSMETASMLLEEYVYPKVVSAYSKPSAPEQAAVEEEQKDDANTAATETSTSKSVTEAMDKEVRDVRSLLASQSAAMRDLQAQMKMIAESQDAIVKSLQLQQVESAKSQKKLAVAADDTLQLELDRQVQQGLQLASGEDFEGSSRASPSPSI